MNFMVIGVTDFSARSFTFVIICLCLAGCSTQAPIHYPKFDPDEVSDRVYDCSSIDYAIQQVDSIRWSMRQDGVELETDFEQMVQLTLATVAVVAYAVSTSSIIPEANPYDIAFTDADRLKKADALLIALLNIRRELNCPLLTRCRLSPQNIDTLSHIESIRSKVESGEMSEKQGIEELSKSLDGMCNVGA